MECSIVIRRFLAAAVLAVVISTLGIGSARAWEGDEPLVIDHTCTDLSKIPSAWIDSTKAMMRMHYGHASHGSQVTCGLEQIELADPFFAPASCPQAAWMSSPRLRRTVTVMPRAASSRMKRSTDASLGAS